MSRYTSRNRPSVCPEIDPAEWAYEIRRRFELVLRPEQIYADLHGRVYAGSEYIARVGASTHPADAIDWTSSIGAFERRGGKVELVEHLSLAEQTRRHGAAYLDGGGI